MHTVQNIFQLFFKKKLLPLRQIGDIANGWQYCQSTRTDMM